MNRAAEFCIIVSGLVVVGFVAVIERTICRSYVGYYDWPRRSLAEYRAEVARLDKQFNG